jgi:hypothetical protein
VTEPMVPRTAKFLRALVAGVAVFVLSFSLPRPAAELFAILIRRHWPEAWSSGSIVWYLDFFAAGLAIAIGRYSFRVERQTESKPDRVDRLLYLCALAAVSIGVFQWAEGHYLRALVATETDKHEFECNRLFTTVQVRTCLNYAVAADIEKFPREQRAEQLWMLPSSPSCGSQEVEH